jgi:hypothetical protein
MHARTFVQPRLALALVGFFCVLSTTAAAPPWVSLVPFKKVEADPTKSYTLTQESGPWMVMAMSFSGDDAEEQAQKLAVELRRDFKLEAFVHRQEIDLSGSVIGLGVNTRNKPKKMKYLHGGEMSEMAVLVGHFPSFEDPAAAKMLEKIRHLQPKSLGGPSATKGNGAVSTNHVRAFYRKITRSEEQKKRGPLGKAFITRNPLLPVDEVAKQSLDPFVEGLNAGIEHSLLRNPSQYTVLVATYRGTASFNEADFEKSVRKNGQDSKIDQAAIKATKVAAQLRQEGLPAYVFHDRHESIVTIGGFDDLGSETQGGRIDLQPEIAAVIKRFEANRNAIPGTDQLGLQPKLVAGIPLDVSPRLILVPRKSIADVYRQAP